jgi:diphthamide synthase (EF-2-diphthine--ammonia ligase)
VHEFYKVLKAIATKLNVNELYFFIQKVANKPVEKLSGHDIEMLQELAVKSTGSIGSEDQAEKSKDLAQRNRLSVLTIVWQYAFFDVINPNSNR